MEAGVRRLFEQYEHVFNACLHAAVDMEDVAALYASEFIAATPFGVTTGKNDEQLKKVMIEGYARYRAMGTKEMRLCGLRISPMDEHHCVAHVSWKATYVRSDRPDVTIDFEVHYLVQQSDAGMKVFGWVSGDEQALLKHHGIV